MKDTLRKVFAPILDIFESGSEPYAYQPSHRKILIFVGVLFSGLTGLVFWLALGAQSPGYFFPVLVFGGIGLLCLVIGLLGSDRAVAKIWGTGKH